MGQSESRPDAALGALSPDETARLRTLHAASSAHAHAHTQQPSTASTPSALLLLQAVESFLAMPPTKPASKPAPKPTSAVSFEVFAARASLLLSGSPADVQQAFVQSVAVQAVFGNSLARMAECLAAYSLPLLSHTLPIRPADAPLGSPGHPASAGWRPSTAFMSLLLAKPRSDAFDEPADTESSSDAFAGSSDFAEWMSQSRLAQTLWQTAMQAILLGSGADGHTHQQQPQQPQQLAAGPPKQQSAILPLDAAVVVQQAVRDSGFDEPQWDLVFSTKQHGRSWTVFQSAIADPQATLMLIRDRAGHVFGGFASAPWVPRPQFYGDSRCFLVSVHPSLGIHRSTGINSNFQYYNHGKQTLANGLGLGGQMDYFGLFVESSFEAGHSMAQPRSTTFGSPQLSQESRFLIDYVEVWCVKQQERDDRLVDPKANKASILGDSENMAFLEMAGKTVYSKQLRPDVEDMAE
ncbi:TLD-domain-containing protein [Entophlyctis helioformis]|nr:TLD-domain-containing protein [Entophlyctis helioformis]